MSERPDTLMRIQLAVNRSHGNPRRPRLSKRLERRFAPLEQASASCYAALEETTRQLHALADEIDGWDDDVSIVRGQSDGKK